MADPNRWPAPQPSMEYPPGNPFTIRRWIPEAGYGLVILGLIWWPEDNGRGWRWDLLLTALYAAGRACWFWWDVHQWRRWQARNRRSDPA
jgi:hypothetical protein